MQQSPKGDLQSIILEPIEFTRPFKTSIIVPSYKSKQSCSQSSGSPSWQAHGRIWAHPLLYSPLNLNKNTILNILLGLI